MTQTVSTSQTQNQSFSHDTDALNENRILILGNGQVGFVGKAALKALGVSAKETKNQHVRDVIIFTSEDDAMSSSPFANVSSGLDPWVVSIRSGAHSLLGKNGLESVFQFDQINHGDNVFVVASIITDNVVPDESSLSEWIEKTLVTPKSAKKIKQDNGTSSDLKNNMFFSLSSDLMVICNDKGVFQDINETFLTSLGYTRAQLSRLSFIDIIHPEDRSIARSIFMNIDDAKESISFDARVVSRQGATLPMEWRLQLDGAQLYIVGKDVSTVTAYKCQLEKQEEQLSEAQSIGHMGHWTWHMDTHSIEWSDEIYRIFGVDVCDFTPSIETLVKYLYRRDIGRTMQAFQRAMIEKRDYEMEFSIHRPSGESRYIKCLGRCRLDADGEVTSLFGIMQDITEQVEHEYALKAAKESVEQAYNAKSQFLANMSHELRTPLNAIIGFSEMIQRQLLGPIGTEKYLDYINGIRESGEHLLDLISDILDMSKIEAGKYELVCEEVNIHKVIQLSTHMMEGRALDNGVKIKTLLKGEELKFTADRRAITQVLLNLLSNAVKFSKDNGQVSVSCEKLKKRVKITVSDNGIGIPAMKLNTITNPFEQVSNQYTREHEGSGLGLAITKELIELHKGSLKIESEVGVGTTVTIYLPIA